MMSVSRIRKLKALILRELLNNGGRLDLDTLEQALNMHNISMYGEELKYVTFARALIDLKDDAHIILKIHKGSPLEKCIEELIRDYYYRFRRIDRIEMLCMRKHREATVILVDTAEKVKEILEKEGLLAEAS